VLIDAVRRFVALSEQVGVKGSDPMVKELMVSLRKSGLSSSQISELSGGKWSGTLVRQYTIGWVGVDEILDNQRKSLMITLRELASSGKDIMDVEHILVLDRSVRARGSSLEEVVELNLNLRNLDLRSGEIERLVTSSRELLEQHLTPSMVQGWMTIDQELVEAGFNNTARMLMYDLCKKYGGVVETLKAVTEFNDFDEIRRERRRLESDVKWLMLEVERLSGVKEELDTEISQRGAMINAVNAASIAGFDAASLITISILAQNLGGPYKVADAIQKYSSLREMDEELEAKKAELENVKKETSDKTQFLTVLKLALVEAEQEYNRNSDVRMVVELLVNPLGIKMSRLDLVSILTRVLDSGARRIEEIPEVLSMPSPARDAAYVSIKALADRLRSLIE
jgi:hypothetical protein